MCHQNVHSLAADLHDYTPGRMRAVIAVGITLCAGVYVAVGSFGYALFGR